jgi:formate hydrogenlyase subunit 4
MKYFVWCIAAILLSPFLGGLISGVDRILTARMQSRVGPPVLQPFYDVLKLFEKQNLVINRFHGDFVWCAVIFTLASVGIFFSGDNLLIALFALVVGNVFLVIAGYSSGSPYSVLGAERELLQMLATEPMILLTAVGFFMLTGSFNVRDILCASQNFIIYLPGVFVGLVYVLTIKLRKSPFDLSTSHHAHQELVKGLTTEFAGPSLGLFEIIHWYETVLLMALVYLFFAAMPWLGIVAVAGIYFVEIIIDNVTARLKWEFMLGSAWAATLILGVGNLILVYLFRG